MEIDVHFVRKRVQRKDLLVHHIPSSEQLADIMTKRLHCPQILYLRNNLMLESPSLRLSEGIS